MSTMLLRLAGPMQSWGTQSRFVIRDTGFEPSKSGVIGLLCAALGRPREAPMDDLVRLRMGVRVDREGTMQSDYHTVGGWHRRADADYGVARFGGDPPDTVVSRRRYLADASFLVGLEARTSDEEVLLQQLDSALAQPVWPLFLGRKAFVPGEPVRLPDVPPLGPGLRHGQQLEQALHSYPWPERWPGERAEPLGRLRVVIEDPAGDQVRMDVPVSFAPLDRRYLPRTVRTQEWERPAAQANMPAEGR
jgi:CRISPR system Cascade subunit CasD